MRDDPELVIPLPTPAPIRRVIDWDETYPDFFLAEPEREEFDPGPDSQFYRPPVVAEFTQAEIRFIEFAQRIYRQAQDLMSAKVKSVGRGDHWW